jgi:hypothetical protein
MNDREYLEHAFKGDEDAVRLILDLTKIADVWDNLIDQDKPASADDINEAFWKAMVDVPGNPVYRRYANDLMPVIKLGIVNWWASNEMQKTPGRAQEIAHVIRYSIADVATLLAMLIGGREWGAQCGPELRLRGQKDDLANFLKEHARA